MIDENIMGEMKKERVCVLYTAEKPTIQSGKGYVQDDRWRKQNFRSQSIPYVSKTFEHQRTREYLSYCNLLDSRNRNVSPTQQGFLNANPAFYRHLSLSLFSPFSSRCRKSSCHHRWHILPTPAKRSFAG